MPGSPERRPLGRLSRSVGDEAPLGVLMLRVPVAVSRGVGWYGDGRGLIPSPRAPGRLQLRVSGSGGAPRGGDVGSLPPPGKELTGSSARERAPCSLTRVLPTSEAGPALARCISAARLPAAGCTPAGTTSGLELLSLPPRFPRPPGSQWGPRALLLLL